MQEYLHLSFQLASNFQLESNPGADRHLVGIYSQHDPELQTLLKMPLIIRTHCHWLTNTKNYQINITKIYVKNSLFHNGFT